MKTIFSVPLVFISALLISGCVTIPHKQKINKKPLVVLSTQDIAMSYSKGSRFSLAPKYIKEISLKSNKIRALHARYTDVIIADLCGYGFKEMSNTNKAMFYVGFGLASGRVNSSLLIYIEDVRTGKKVWRGVAQGYIYNGADRMEEKQRIAVIKGLMKQFHMKNEL